MIWVNGNKQEPFFKTFMSRGNSLHKYISNVSLKDGEDNFMGKIKSI